MAEPLEVACWISVVKERWDICSYAQRFIPVSAHILCGTSLWTLTALSMDRLLALMLGLRYRQVVTVRKVYITVAGMWFFSIVSVACYFWYAFMSWFPYTIISLCLFTSCCCYTKIFSTLRRSQRQVHNHTSQRQLNQAIPLNTARYRKAVYSVLWVQVALVVCNLPYSIAVALTSPRGMTVSKSSNSYRARQCTITFAYLNSSLNPLLYCWKIREIRQAVKETLRHLFR